MYKVKICGIKESRHLDAAVRYGASYVGFVFFEKSRRNLSLRSASLITRMVPNSVCKVALMVDPTDEHIKKVLENASIDMIQLHGNETRERIEEVKRLSRLPIMKAIGISLKEDLMQVKRFERVVDKILLDAKPPKNSLVPGGLGKPFDWNILSGFQCKIPWLLAGGLSVDNVKTAIKKTGAYEFDVSSGVEDKFGVKSERKIADFLNMFEGGLIAK